MRNSLIKIIGYANNSYIRDLEDKKLITKYSFFLGKKIVTLFNKQ